MTNTEKLHSIKNGMIFYAKVNPSRGIRRRCKKESDNSIFVYGKNMRRYGHRYNAEMFLTSFDVILPKDPEEKWHRRLKSAVKRLDASGLWPFLREVFANLDTMTLEERDTLRAIREGSYRMKDGLWQMKTQEEMDKEYAPYAQKYPFAFIEGESGHLILLSEYICEISDCKLHQMYFGYCNAQVKNNLKEAMKTKTPYSHQSRAKYDVSVHYDPVENKAWYSEEYKGCGNGHYYLALDHSSAVFYEDD